MFLNNLVPERLTFSFLQFLKVKYKPCYIKLSPKEQILKNVLQVYQKEIDILNIIEKIQEIDKLKELLLDNEQLNKFKSMERPSIMRKIRDSIRK